MKKKVLRSLTIAPLFLTTLLTTSCASTIMKEIEDGLYYLYETKGYNETYILTTDNVNNYEFHLDYFLLNINQLEEKDYLQCKVDNMNVETQINETLANETRDGIISDAGKERIAELSKNRHAILDLYGTYFEFNFNICIKAYQYITLENEKENKVEVEKYSDSRSTEKGVWDYDNNVVTGTYIGNYKQNLYEYFFALDRSDPSYSDSISDGKNQSDAANLMLVLRIEDKAKVKCMLFSQMTDSSSLSIRWKSKWFSMSFPIQLDK